MASKKRESYTVAKPGRGNTELIFKVVPGSAHPYLWIGNKNDEHLGTLSGKAALSRLAHALLQEIGEEGRDE